METENRKGSEEMLRSSVSAMKGTIILLILGWVAQSHEDPVGYVLPWVVPTPQGNFRVFFADNYIRVEDPETGLLDPSRVPCKMITVGSKGDIMGRTRSFLSTSIAEVTMEREWFSRMVKSENRMPSSCLVSWYLDTAYCLCSAPIGNENRQVRTCHGTSIEKVVGDQNWNPERDARALPIFSHLIAIETREFDVKGERKILGNSVRFFIPDRFIALSDSEFIVAGCADSVPDGSGNGIMYFVWRDYNKPVAMRMARIPDIYCDFYACLGLSNLVTTGDSLLFCYLSRRKTGSKSDNGFALYDYPKGVRLDAYMTSIRLSDMKVEWRAKIEENVHWNFGFPALARSGNVLALSFHQGASSSRAMEDKGAISRIRVILFDYKKQKVLLRHTVVRP